MSSTELLPAVSEEKSFAVAVIDNFDLNIGALHGENSIHILNRIIIQAPKREQIITDVTQCLDDLCNLVAADVQDIHLNNILIDRIQNTATGIDKTLGIVTFQPYKDNAYDEILLAYGLMEHAFAGGDVLTKIINSPTKMHIPLLSGFLATFIKTTPGGLSKITFSSPINQDPSALSTSKICIKSMRKDLIDSGFQKELVIVADEKSLQSMYKGK